MAMMQLRCDLHIGCVRIGIEQKPWRGARLTTRAGRKLAVIFGRSQWSQAIDDLTLTSRRSSFRAVPPRKGCGIGMLGRTKVASTAIGLITCFYRRRSQQSPRAYCSRSRGSRFKLCEHEASTRKTGGGLASSHHFVGEARDSRATPTVRTRRDRSTG
jgi:hypothetical protein